MAKFCAQEAEAAAAGSCVDAQSRGTLWSVLRVMAQHQGRISSAPYSLLSSPVQGSGKQASPEATPEAQLSAALLGVDGPFGAGEQQQLLLPGGPAPAAAAGAAAEVQGLLLQGRRSEALRWGLRDSDERASKLSC